MSYSNKSKGWRNITVENQRFRWRFVTVEKGTLTLQGLTSSCQQVIVTMHDWYNPWDFIGHNHLLPNEPKVITAKFAAEAIIFALAHGWHPEQAGQAIQVDYRDKSFALPEPEITT